MVFQPLIRSVGAVGALWSVMRLTQQNYREPMHLFLVEESHVSS